MGSTRSAGRWEFLVLSPSGETPETSLSLSLCTLTSIPLGLLTLLPALSPTRTMFTTADLWEPPRLERNADGTATEIVSAAWNFHKYISYSTADGRSKILSYGPPPGSLDEFCFRAQIVNYTQYRALLEGELGLLDFRIPDFRN